MSLKVLFLDMNAFFASVEQQYRPELRGRPVGVVPVETDTTCCIAVSYEAKACGVKTGTLVRQARQLCPCLKLVVARPAIYVRCHHAIVAAVETCLPVHAVHSIDEMSCRLLGRERQPDEADRLARLIKQAILRDVGECLRCSIGVAPNRLLAKLASDMQKPDGLVIITRQELPSRLYALQLDDFPGIGSQMLKRMHRHGVRTVRQLCALSEKQLRTIFNSITGELWWRWLRGEDPPEAATHRRTVGHSHVLPPELRHEAGAHAVLVRLIHKAAARLRRLNYWARRIMVRVDHVRQPPWKEQAELGLCQDTLTMLEAFNRLWPRRPPHPPLRVGITLVNLSAAGSVTIPLFEGEQNRLRLAQAMDRVNARHGPHAVYFAGMHHALGSAPMRISFTSIPDLDLPA
ncbi:MAG TPA: DNA polymerase [Phycisphaerae bacterium]|nr:DNA polymerase [Phycisphaerae bacterium]